MKRIFAIVLILAMVLLCCTGCGSDTTEHTQRQVSSAFVGFGKSGLEVANGDLKESGAVFEDTVVEFQDPVMEEMLRTILGIPEGDVRRSDLQKIHAIYNRSGRYWSNLQSEDGTIPQDGTEWRIQGEPATLADLALCDNLQWMEFSNITVPSLEPLMGLTQLEHLLFKQSVLETERLDELGRLPVLTELEVDLRVVGGAGPDDKLVENYTADGSFLLPMADRLTSLQVSCKLAWSTEVLAQLTHLETLAIYTPDDLSFLASMPNLTHLSLYDYDQDWSGLRKAESLTYLDIDKCEGIALDDVRPLVNLEYLGLSMTNFTPKAYRNEIIEALPSLTGLHIQG